MAEKHGYGAQGSAERVTTIQLSEDQVRKVASELGIRNLDRIPREIPVATVSEHAGRALGFAHGRLKAALGSLLVTP
jgi:hypothetical protein